MILKPEFWRTRSEPAVVGVLGGERRHQDRCRVTHLVEQRVQIGVLDRPQRDNRHVLVSILRWTSAKRSSPAIQQRPTVR